MINHDSQISVERGMQKSNLFLFSYLDRKIMKKLIMVGNTMDPYLEQEHGLSLILHERDFPGGVTIMANIIRAVERSRKMIMLLSK